MLAALKAARPLSDEAIKEINQAHASLKAHNEDQDQEHWLHDDVEPAAHLLLLTRCMASQPYVRQIFDSVNSHVSTCPQCVVSYHSAKVSLYLSFDFFLCSSIIFLLYNLFEALFRTLLHTPENNGHELLGN